MDCPWSLAMCNWFWSKINRNLCSISIDVAIRWCVTLNAIENWKKSTNSKQIALTQSPSQHMIQYLYKVYATRFVHRRENKRRDSSDSSEIYSQQIHRWYLFAEYICNIIASKFIKKDRSYRMHYKIIPVEFILQLQNSL